MIKSVFRLPDTVAAGTYGTGSAVSTTSAAAIKQFTQQRQPQDGPKMVAHTSAQNDARHISRFA